MQYCSEASARLDFIQGICTQYCDGLYWTFKYYTEGCIAWNWAFTYPYPPLLAHLCEYVPYLKCADSFVKSEPLDPLAQLCFVLPKESQYLIPAAVAEEVQKHEVHTVHRIVWAFCSYFWESHVEFTHSPIKQICSIVAEYRKV